MTKARYIWLDVLKGLAMIAVVLYHFGGQYAQFGYLGVDIFLVIGGFLMAGSFHREMENGTYGWWKYMLRRINRMWPLLIFVMAVSLAAGYFLMLPDDYENLAQSTIASGVFANNILANITTKNYWDVVNMYKPLMHTWYLGVLMQATLIISLLAGISAKCTKNHKRTFTTFLVGITVISLGLYLFPGIRASDKFYFVFYRVFEVTAGLCAGLMLGTKEKGKAGKVIFSAAVIVLLACMVVPVAIIPANVRLLAVVAASAAAVVYMPRVKKENILLKGLALIGKTSFSIYLCHQVICAFMKYSWSDSTGWMYTVVYLLIVGVCSGLMYLVGEKNIAKVSQKKPVMVFLCSLVCCIALCAASFVVHSNAGIVRDVPELGVSQENAKRGMHAAYCDVPYRWNKDFEDAQARKVLVFGNSFGRDFANILNESSLSGSLEISYSSEFDREGMAKLAERIETADWVFYVLGPGNEEVPSYAAELVPENKLCIVGNKSFGSSNGIIYRKRGSENYFSQSVKIDPVMIQRNERQKEMCGERFVDMISPVLTDENAVRVFTDDCYFISQDCRHLTQPGAQYYARLLDLDWVLK